MINNYESENEENQDDCQKMEKKCEEEINNNKDLLTKYKKDLDLDNIDSDDVCITEIYTDIIKYLKAISFHTHEILELSISPIVSIILALEYFLTTLY